MIKSVIALSVGFIAGTHAFWRMECPGRVASARIDPIVNRGECSPHVHSVHGSSGFSDSATYDELINADCTSCRVKEDKSSYWHSSLYFKDANTGKYEMVTQAGGMLAYYYLLYGDNIKPFPKGFRMLSGKTDRRNYTAGDPTKPDPEKALWPNNLSQDELSQRALGFNCLNYDRQPEPTLYRHFLPDKEYLDKNCKNGVRFEIMFPSCWKGGDAIDSHDHMSHVAFPHLVMSGDCPAGFSTRMASLMYEVIWETNRFQDRSGRFVLSNGDTTGYSLHADFFNGWDEQLLKKAIQTCTNPSGRIEDCPVFTIQDKDEALKCSMQGQMPTAISQENVKGPMSQLPGNGESSGGEKAPSNVNQPSSSHDSSSDKSSDEDNSLSGQSMKDSVAPAIPAPSKFVVPAMNTEAAQLEVKPIPAPTAAPADVPSYYSTQYITKGNVVSVVYLLKEVVTTTEVRDETVTVPANVHYRRAAHLRAHGHRKHRF